MAQEVYFKDIRNVIIDNLLNCKYDLKIAVAWFTDEKIISTVNSLLLQGVNVTIIIYDDHINKKDLFEKLHYNKAKILLSKKLMHHKFCVIDEITVINGSYNWTNSAKTNDENIQITFNDKIFAKNFTEEFNKIISNCNKIDDYFKHSVLNIKNLEFEFEDFYSKWSKYIFPYFFDLKTFLPSKTNSKLEINGYVYLIKNKEEEKTFLRLYFLSKSNYSVIEILKLSNEKITFPLRFKNVCLDSKNKDDVAEFLKSSYTVEEHIKQNSNTKYFLFKIDKDGEQITEKVEFTHRISTKSYLYNCQNKSYFIDENLKLSFFDYNIEEVIALKDDFNYYINAKLLVVSNLTNSIKSFGLMDINKKILIPILYDKYKFNKIWLKNFENLCIDFVEFPVLERFYINSVEYIKVSICSNTSSKPLTDKIIYKYSIEDYKLKEKYILDKFDIKQTRDSHSYYFLSEENYKYKEFYLKIKNFKFDTSKIKSNQAYLTYNEFLELKEDYNYDASFNYLTKKYQSLREKALLEEKIKSETKKSEEGCYIATMVFRDYDNPNVILLRNFRDKYLNTFHLGKLFINNYYKYSPKFVLVAKKNILLFWISKIFVLGMVKLINLIFYRIKS